jgi:hypothetical protein
VPGANPIRRLGQKILQRPCQNRAGSNVIGATGHEAPYNHREERDMKYVLLVYTNEAELVNATKEQKAETFAAYSAYTEAMKKAGVFVSASGLP